MVIYNPINKFYKSKTGAIKENEMITFRITGNYENAFLFVRSDSNNSITHHEMKNCGEFFEVTLSFVKGLYYYHFLVDNNQYVGLNFDYKGIIQDNLPEFQLTVFSEDYSVPDWFSGGIMYQIFPDRFCRGETEKHIKDNKVLHDDWNECPVYTPNEQGKIINNDFFGGDFKGIISKLDYLKNLGVTCIYLNPIFEAYSNHRYDTGNYFAIDNLLGTEDDFKELISACHKNGIKVILDGVFNHTGDDSVYFNKYNHYNSVGAYNDKNSPYYKWYEFLDYPDKYKSWWGILTLPQINKHSPEFAEFIAGNKGVLNYYTSMGVDGWRLDVVDELSKDFTRKIRKSIKNANKDGMIIGEVWEDATNKISYGERREYFQGYELDSVMNYPLKEAIFDFILNKNINKLSYVVKEQVDHYPKMCLDSLMNILSTHDTLRLLTVVGGVNCGDMTKEEMANTFIPDDKMDNAIFNLKVASLLQFTLCGVPCIYYGDEAGMEGYKDPLNRRTYPWGMENKEILNWYRLLTGIRQKYSCFNKGEFKEIYAKKGLFVYKRYDEKSEILIAINISREQYNFSFDGTLKDIINNKILTNQLNVNENEYYILINPAKE